MNSTTDKGNIAELYIAADLIKRGFVALSPLGNHPHYDLVAEKDGVFKRIQVRYVLEKNGVVEVRLYTTGHSGKVSYHTAKEVDIIAVFTPSSQQIFYLTRGEFKDIKTTISLRLTPPKNRMKKGIRYAKDYQDIN